MLGRKIQIKLWIFLKRLPSQFCHWLWKFRNSSVYLGFHIYLDQNYSTDSRDTRKPADAGAGMALWHSSEREEKGWLTANWLTTKQRQKHFPRSKVQRSCNQNCMELHPLAFLFPPSLVPLFYLNSSGTFLCRTKFSKANWSVPLCTNSTIDFISVCFGKLLSTPRNQRAEHENIALG